MYEPNDGDIIYTKGWNDREMVKVIVKNHGYYATVVCLYGKESYDNEFAINVGGELGKLHADLGRLSYSKTVDMGDAELIRPLDANEYDRLLKNIGKVLGISDACTSNLSDKELDSLKAEINKLHAALKAAEEENAALKNDGQEDFAGEKAEMQRQIDMLQKEKDKLVLAGTKMEAEKGVYENLYKDLLKTMTADKSMPHD